MADVKHIISLLFVLISLLGLSVSCDEPKRIQPASNPPSPVEPEDPDPVTLVNVPGAYGVEGGDVIFNFALHQLSRLNYGDKCSYRLLGLSDMSVISVSGIPVEMKEKSEISFLYRVQSKGHTVVSKQYNMKVLRIKDGMAWLKQDDSTFFVILL